MEVHKIDWPHAPIRSAVVSAVVIDAFRTVGLDSGCARDLRSTVATHLLRQGEGLSTIADVLGHATCETTQRYAKADVELLRRLLEEEER